VAFGNAYFPTCVRLERVTLIKVGERLLNAKSPIVVTEEGMVTPIKIQPKNAESPIVVTEEGMV
jgi:hypothetical protein